MDLKTFIKSLEKEIQGDVLSDDYSLGMYATDASVYQIRPLVIVLPKNESDVIAAIKFAHKYSITIVPRGGGTSLGGQVVGKSMIMDFSKYMNNILEINPEEKWVRVQPGIVRDVLNAQLSPYHLHFAPDPATTSRANIGGMVGNNSSGTKSILYGKTVDHVLETKVILADGTMMTLRALAPEAYGDLAIQENREGEIYRKFKKIIEENHSEIKARFPKVMRRVGGYNLDEFTDEKNWNLSKLITGSEGTLATVLEVKVNLEPLPEYKSVCVVHFQNLLEAIKAVELILEFQPSAVEILDKTVVELSRENLTTQRSCHFVEGNPEAILIVEFYGDNKQTVIDRPRNMITKLKLENFGYAYPFFPEGPDYDDVWIIRSKGLGLLLGMKGDKKPIPFIEDAGIPTEVLPEYIDRVLKICQENQTNVAMYAHASVGVIHVRPILDLRQAADIERFENISKQVFDLVVEYGGSWSGEHGDGLVRSAYNEQFFGKQVYKALKEVKVLFDPDGIMNPGKIVDAPPMVENLRYGTDYSDSPIKSEYIYRKDNTFEDAVHMCSGVGECRKILGGTMCPSYKATRDEEHSTRGRANALRLAMSGQQDLDGLTSARLHEVLDLCLSCKACKSECPSNVDMAKLKSEVSQLYYDKHGEKLRDKIIKNSADMAARLSGNAAGIVNRIQGTKLFRKLLEHVAGFDRRRSLPSYAKLPFSKWYEKNAQPAQDGRRQVALFADTYLNYHDTQIGISAYQLLADCGYDVLLANAGCCQRPKISHGFLREAKKEGLKTVLKLDEFMSKGIPVLVCEPGCASALTDDLPDLIEDEELAKRLNKHVFMIDQFLYQEMESGQLDVEFISDESEINLHGHCHQKTLYGTKGMNEILAKISGLKSKEINSGCCGMAGSFGYEKEHYEISEKIGAQDLFSPIKEMSETATVVACGFSCRHQIEHFTGRKPKHWVEVIKVK